MAEELCKSGPVISGSCAVLALMDPISLTMHVACLGDCRAVLARRPATPGEEWETISLSVDQTGSNEAEKERIALQHPGETPINNGRLLGMAVTRSFGDARFKWPADKVESLERRCFAKPKVSDYLTPPYLIAEPILQSTKIQAGDILILGSDGFWDHMSNEHGVLCASMWAETNDKRNGSQPPNRSGKDTTKHNMEFGRSKKGYPYRWKLSKVAYTVEDDNLATHMMKNAFGGLVRDLFVAVMSVEPPYSYEVRDDATVMAVQFQAL
jgi:pyruvate dehydrogenase phosphatase